MRIDDDSVMRIIMTRKHKINANTIQMGNSVLWYIAEPSVHDAGLVGHSRTFDGKDVEKGGDEKERHTKSVKGPFFIFICSRGHIDQLPSSENQ